MFFYQAFYHHCLCFFFITHIFLLGILLLTGHFFLSRNLLPITHVLSLDILSCIPPVLSLGILSTEHLISYRAFLPTKYLIPQHAYFLTICVDKIIRIVFLSVEPMSPYIHKFLSWYKTKRENSRSFKISSSYIWWYMVTKTKYSTSFHDFP